MQLNVKGLTNFYKEGTGQTVTEGFCPFNCVASFKKKFIKSNWLGLILFEFINKLVFDVLLGFK